MHLITAAVISLLANKDAAGLFGNIRRNADTLRVPSFPGIIERRHVLPGRLRFRVNALKGNRDGAALLENRLPVLPGVGSVRCDTRTGTVLVTGESSLDGALVVAGIAKILGLEKEIDRRPVSRITRAVRRSWQGVDRALYDRTGGLLTVRDLVGILLLASTVRQVVSTGRLGLPPAFTLVWWLFHLSYGNGGEGAE